MAQGNRAQFVFCERPIIGKIKGHILNLPQPGSAAATLGYINPDDLAQTIKRKPAA
ncbi:hypothetical protein I0D00_07090 [Pseudomonas lalucatii]|uniref:Uncharacterized protein n=1 Tax=Pseudomonas lalucatii TaxID=1424203 RepID=A0ABS5Q042_9PSED|nr:hypothetical protein [Pseudomonas lalucatii]MBS7661711.1 hypothetical protein [Pseudomonas lalucatii]MBS7691251.1 hypothetical protein [Pseudomonas lalucatii]MBS7726328.1 hypothetical protein [Pseudomonas lalucatii]QVM88099.1 hypothetical protein I0D68_04225 [Pseudomonas lalucatii]